MKVGPNELVRKFDELYEEYNEKWGDKKEVVEREKFFDKTMAREEVMPEVHKVLVEEVDDMIKSELENLRQMSGAKSKKKKKKGKTKKKGGRKKVKKI